MISEELKRYKQIQSDLIHLKRAINNLDSVCFTESKDLCEDMAEVLREKAKKLKNERNELEQEIDRRIMGSE